MITHKHKNITLHVTQSDYTDILGDGHLVTDGAFLAKMVEENCSFYEYFDQYDYAELDDYLTELDRCDNEDDQDDIIDFFKANATKEFYVTNPDCFIAIFEYCIIEDDREFKFDFQTSHISWVLHDLLHAEHDAAGCTIYVDWQVERDRIFESMEQVYDLYPNNKPSFDLLQELEDNFSARFNKTLGIIEQLYNQNM